MSQARKTHNKGGAAATTDRRSGDRMITVLRIGKIVTGARQELCLVRNVSARGMMAHVSQPHEPGEKVQVELQSDFQIEGEVVWAKEQNIGIRFDDEIEVYDLLTHRMDEEGRKSRPPRIRIQGRARIWSDGRSSIAELLDISQGGLKVEPSDLLDVGGDVVITINDLGTFKGVVRWRRNDQVGISFLRSIPFDQLSDWLAHR